MQQQSLLLLLWLTSPKAQNLFSSPIIHKDYVGINCHEAFSQEFVQSYMNLFWISQHSVLTQFLRNSVQKHISDTQTFLMSWVFCKKTQTDKYWMFSLQHWRYVHWLTYSRRCDVWIYVIAVSRAKGQGLCCRVNDLYPQNVYIFILWGYTTAKMGHGIFGRRGSGSLFLIN